MTLDEQLHRRPANLPAWLPAWASQLADLYFSGTTAAFVLHGNTYDLFRVDDEDRDSSPSSGSPRYGVLAEFLAEQLFGRCLRAFAGRDEQRLKDMVALTNKKLGDLSALPKDPAATFALLDRFVRNNIMAAEPDRQSLALILDQASYVFPSGEPGRLNLQASSQLVTMLNWAMSPHVKRLNMAFVMVDEKLADLSDRLTGNPHVATIEVPLPDAKDREAFISVSAGTTALKDFSDFDASQLATLTAGISLTDLNVLVDRSRSGCSSGSVMACWNSSSRVGRWTRLSATRPRRRGCGRMPRCSNAGRWTACRWDISSAVPSGPASRFSPNA